MEVWNSIKTQIFYKIKYNSEVIKGHLKILKSSFSAIQKKKLFKNVHIMKTQMFLFEWSLTLKVIQGYITPIFRQNHSSTFVYGPIFLEICTNLLISCSVDTIYDLKCYFYAIEKFFHFFTLRPSDLITTFIYALMYNFCPYFFVIPAYMYNYQKFV